MNEYTADSYSEYDPQQQRDVPMSFQLSYRLINQEMVNPQYYGKEELPQWPWPKPLTQQQIQQELAAERARQTDKTL